MLMEGVEILNQVEILTHPEWVVIAEFVCISALVIGIIGFILCCICLTDWMHIFFFCMTLTSLLLSVIFNNISKKPTTPTGKYEYQVTIDDSVSMNKFYEKYEIVEVNGKIYTIREKE